MPFISSFISSLGSPPAPFISTVHNFGQNWPGSMHNFPKPNLRFCEFGAGVMSKPKAGRSGFPEHVRDWAPLFRRPFFFSPADDISIAQPL
jgi:hypothetical protein